MRARELVIPLGSPLRASALVGCVLNGHFYRVLCVSKRRFPGSCIFPGRLSGDCLVEYRIFFDVVGGPGAITPLINTL